MKIFRKRYIPNEIVDISGDKILFNDEKLIVTQWKTIKPRKDISHGMSFAFLQEGYKISKFYNHNNDFLYWYVDIIDVKYESESESYTFTDLLADVKLYPDGKLEVLDLDELAECLETNLISKETGIVALKNLHKVMELINKNNFPPEECTRF